MNVTKAIKEGKHIPSVLYDLNGHVYYPKIIEGHFTLTEIDPNNQYIKPQMYVDKFDSFPNILLSKEEIDNLPKLRPVRSFREYKASNQLYFVHPDGSIEEINKEQIDKMSVENFKYLDITLHRHFVCKEDAEFYSEFLKEHDIIMVNINTPLFDQEWLSDVS